MGFAAATVDYYCPGYCGRILDLNGTLSDCQACPWGSRTRDGVCAPCDVERLSAYDYLYLTFIAVVPLLLHSFFIEYYAPRRSNRLLLLAQHVSSAVESAAAAMLSVLLIPPTGQLRLNSCGMAGGLKDWYTMFYNPIINYTTTLRCTQEAVFPLYSLPFIYHGVSLAALLLVRPCLLLPLRHCLLRRARRHPAASPSTSKHHRPQAAVAAVRASMCGASRAVYAALYALPLLSLTHAALSGVVYYAFAYLLLAVTLASNALHLALYDDQTSPRAVLRRAVTRAGNVMSLGVHALLVSFCAVALNYARDDADEERQPPRWAVNVAAALLAPMPTLFYVATVGLTDPKKLNRLL